MAISDYLTDEEWDACFYRMAGGAGEGNLGAAIRDTIDKLLTVGYEFTGLDESGNKAQQISSGNPSKVCMFIGNPHGVDPVALLESGRNFLKRVSPELVEETDEEWDKQMADARR